MQKKKNINLTLKCKISIHPKAPQTDWKARLQNKRSYFLCILPTKRLKIHSQDIQKIKSIFKTGSQAIKKNTARAKNCTKGNKQMSNKNKKMCSSSLVIEV